MGETEQAKERKYYKAVAHKDGKACKVYQWYAMNPKNFGFPHWRGLDGQDYGRVGVDNDGITITDVEECSKEELLQVLRFLCPPIQSAIEAIKRIERNGL